MAAHCFLTYQDDLLDEACDTYGKCYKLGKFLLENT